MALETFEKLPEEKKALILSTGIREFSRKSYKDVSTDSITRSCQISKGILFHYFGSKKEYYLYCLDTALSRLTAQTEEVSGTDFYEILFSGMKRKLSLCMQYPDETHLVNMASRDASAEISREKAEIIRKHSSAVQTESANISAPQKRLFSGATIKTSKSGFSKSITSVFTFSIAIRELSRT